MSAFEYSQIQTEPPVKLLYDANFCLACGSPLPASFMVFCEFEKTEFEVHGFSGDSSHSFECPDDAVVSPLCHSCLENAKQRALLEVA